MKLNQARRSSVVLTVVAITCLPLFAAESKSRDPLALKSADAALMQFYLMDGSMVSGKFQLKEVELQTDFGLLKIPVESLLGFAPGLSSHPLSRNKIQSLIATLGESEVEKRESAIETLIQLGPGIKPEVDRVLKAGGEQLKAKLKTGLEELQNELEQSEPEETGDVRVSLAEGDAVETANFTAVGHIVPQSFVVVSPYGDLKLKLADICRAQRETAAKSEFRKSIKVNGVSNLVTKEFADSGIRVQKGDRITVSADGQINMTSAGQEAKSSPDGAMSFDWYVPEKILGGALVAKIGNGEVQKIGSKNTFVAERSGLLRFGIAMSEQFTDEPFAGAYNVRIRVAPK